MGLNTHTPKPNLNVGETYLYSGGCYSWDRE